MNLDKLTFEDFKRYALDESLSEYEKIGFPNSLREGFETVICEDIVSKVFQSPKANPFVIDIGCGAGALTNLLISIFSKGNATIYLVDSIEVLSRISISDKIIKVPGCFPNLSDFIENQKGMADTILIYSVLQSVILEQNVFSFLDNAVELLAPGGKMLIGDIPNYSKRKRFFSSGKGIACHQKYVGSNELPNVKFNVLEKDRIDDSLILSILMRYRMAGFDAYICPQPASLPFSSRREDVVICRP